MNISLRLFIYLQTMGVYCGFGSLLGFGMIKIRDRTSDIIVEDLLFYR